MGVRKPATTLARLVSRSPLDLLANDTWALGALLAFMLTGRDLFGMHDPHATQLQRTNDVTFQLVTWVRHEFDVTLWIHKFASYVKSVMTCLSALAAVQGNAHLSSMAVGRAADASAGSWGPVFAEQWLACMGPQGETGWRAQCTTAEGSASSPPRCRAQAGMPAVVLPAAS